jgi:hypothetical protein
MNEQNVDALERDGAPETHAHAVSSGFRRYWLDGVLGILGTAMGWMSLWYPFGRDQGLYHYVAREWMVHGAVPYRDVLDHKTPGIYMIHGLAISLFGVNQWGIRLLELIGTLLTALLAATFTAGRGEAVRPGVRGAAIVCINILFYGQLIFWDLSQSELWYALLGLASVWAARRWLSEPRAQVGAGVFAGAALVMKPPSIWFVLIALVVLLFRVREAAPRKLLRSAAGLVRFAAGAAAVGVPVLAYFAVVDAMPAMVEIVVRSNSYYAKHETDVKSLGVLATKLREFFWIFPWTIAPLVIGGMAALAMAIARGDRARRDRHLLGAALALAGLAATVMQLKFYILHWVVLIAPATVVFANVAADFHLLVPRLRGRAWAPLAPVVILLACWGTSSARALWLTENRVVVDYLRGASTREEFSRFFQIPVIGFWYEESEKVGLWLKAHSRPDDFIAVRGFQPEIYEVAERRYPGRFFWTTFLTSATRGEPDMVARWHEEERKVFERTPPRFVVALHGIGAGHDAVSWFQRLGYQEREVMGPYVIMERVPVVEVRGTP